MDGRRQAVLPAGLHLRACTSTSCGRLREQGIRIELPPSTFVVHFGGWKKLRQQAVTKPVLTDHAAEVFGLAAGSIVDIYGFTEQLGVIYPDDSQGVKRTPTYAEVLVRDPRTLEIVPDGAVGLLEFVCPLPHSYPGVAVLLDDMGRIVSRDPASDGWQGTGFEIVGRAERAEARGCGDTLPEVRSLNVTIRIVTGPSADSICHEVPSALRSRRPADRPRRGP